MFHVRTLRSENRATALLQQSVSLLAIVVIWNPFHGKECGLAAAMMAFLLIRIAYVWPKRTGSNPKVELLRKSRVSDLAPLSLVFKGHKQAKNSTVQVFN